MSSYFEWLDSYSVGVRTFDESHKNLVEIVNKFVTATLEHKPLEDLTDLLTILIRYTRHHFRDEEDLMKETGYDLFEEHRKQHDVLFDQVLNFTGDFFHGRIERSKFAEFVIYWLVTHILEEDMKYKEHFERLGIQ